MKHLNITLLCGIFAVFLVPIPSIADMASLLENLDEELDSRREELVAQAEAGDVDAQMQLGDEHFSKKLGMYNPGKEDIRQG